MLRMIPSELARFACAMLVLAALLAQLAYADTISNAIIPISACNAEDDAAAAGTFGGACDFPDGSALIANGGNTETHSALRSSTRYWGGVNTTSYNSSETECIALTSVSMCYEWWSSAGGQDCDVSVDANGGASYTAITTTCPGTGANPGVTCFNATASETWSCSSFFGASGTRARVKSEGRKTGGNGAQSYTWDVLYYNVTYRRDREAPVVTLISPANASTWNSSGTVLFQYNVTDESAISNCSLIINGSTYQTSTTVARNTTQNFSQVLTNGNYTWRVNCTDNSTNKNNGTSALRNLEVFVPTDSAPPVVTLISPANASAWNSSNTVLFEYNATDALSGIANCSLIINGTVNQTDFTVTEGATQNFTGNLANGNYTWRVNCTDDSANSNQGASPARTLQVNAPVDAVPPVVTLISPANASTWNSSNTVLFAYNTTDAGSAIAFCELIVNGVVLANDTTITEGDTQNFIWDMVNGSYTWSVNCTDTSFYSNEGASQAYSLTVSVPLRKAIFINGFEDSSGTGTTGFSSVWSVEYGTDANEAQIQSGIVRNGIYAAQMEEGDEGEVAISIAPNYLNLSGYTNCVLNYSFQITANWDATDYMYVDIYDGTWHYNATELAGSSYTGGVWYNLSMNLSNYSMVDGFRVRFDQEADLDNEASYWDDIIITCDRNFVMPNVTLISPANASTWNTSSTVTFSYNVTDVDNSILFCAFILNNSVVDYDFTITEGATQNFTRVLTSGNYIWGVNCTDYTLYRGASSIWNLTVGLPAPYVTTDKDTYESCGTVFYKVWTYDQNDALINSNLTISIYNTSVALQNTTNTSTGNGGTGIYLGNYSLDVSDALGSWLIVAIADNLVKGTQNFFVGTTTTKWKIDIDFTPDSIVYLNGTSVTMNFTVWTKEGIRQTGLLPGGIQAFIDSANVTSSLSASGEGYTYAYTANSSGSHVVNVSSGDVNSIRGFNVR